MDPAPSWRHAASQAVSYFSMNFNYPAQPRTFSIA